MRALVTYEQKQFAVEMREKPIPDIDDDEVLL